MPKSKKKTKPRIGLDPINDGNKEIAFDILKSEGVKSVTIDFEGSGDSGQLEPSSLDDRLKKKVVKGSRISQGTVWSPEGKSCRWKENCTLEEILQSVCYDALEISNPGWEINEGSFGQFVFLVDERVVNFEFNQRIVETELSEYEL